MANIDLTATQAELSRLLSEERRLLDELERLLMAEREALQSDHSPERLEAACEERQHCMGALLRLQEERAQLLTHTGHSSDAAGLLQLIRRCDLQGALPPQWAHCAALAKRCRELNNQNGALVASRMRRVQGVLDILTGQDSDASRTYSRGLQEALRPAGAVFSVEI